MARVPIHHYGSSHAQNGAKPIVRKKKPYKVVMEVVTQEKKKLRSTIAYTADAPPGYTFVPLGHPDLTDYCKECCRRRNLEAYVVTAQPKKQKSSNIDKRYNRDQVPRIDTQRVGHHFPDGVIEEACNVLGYVWRHGQFQKSSRNYEESQLARSLRDYSQRMQLQGRPMTNEETEDQIRSAVLEVFPKIPETDLKGVITHAFEEGTNRVGNAKDLTLARRVQLAVGAFIRHQYTDYDLILKSGRLWPEARAQVQAGIYAKLREWRDESDESQELEETFREVIVLDDEEDDDVSDTSEETSSIEREASLEIVSSQATARELQPENPVDYPSQNQHAMSRSSRRVIYLKPIYASGRSSQAHSPQQMPKVVRKPDPPSHARSTSTSQSRQSHTDGSRIVQGPDGVLYNLRPIAEEPAVVEYPPSVSNSHHFRASTISNSRYSHVNNHVHQQRRPPTPHLPRRLSGDDVLPSVETEVETEPIQSPRRNAFVRPGYDDRMSVSYQPVMQSPKRKAIYEADVQHYTQHEHLGKRVMPSDYIHPPSTRSHTSMHGRVESRPADMYNRARPPPPEYIDLTSSPGKPTHRRGKFDLAPVQSNTAPGPSRHSYVPTPTFFTYRDPGAPQMMAAHNDGDAKEGTQYHGRRLP